MPNRLSKETSPYLLQHAHNPVDWYPWSEEAFDRAKAEDKPVLVSIGYAACHWCHVMERESFENHETAALMNEHFINIKVDREERPDVDHIYMDAVQAISGSGGWPLNVFLLPNRQPFYGGTYFPPKRAFNRPSWTEILQSVSDAFQDRREELESQGEQLTEHLKNSNVIGTTNVAGSFSKQQIDTAFSNCMKSADKEWGGFGNAPKFPQTFTISFLLRYAHLTGNADAKKQALLSLDKMIQGGIYDQVAGGFSRYSTDREWLAPHFEKMLYDNALLITVLSEAYQFTNLSVYKKVIEETIDFLERELMHSEGGFYSALDADSEGVEGKFYVWSKEEADEILGKDAKVFSAYYDITAQGNWEHTNILRVKAPISEVASKESLSVSELEQIIERGKEKLLERRSHRIRPALDDKIILGWNALMNSALSKAYAATGEERYRLLAERNMHFLLDKFRLEGTFFHTWKDGQAKYSAFLDDLTYLISALLDLSIVTTNLLWVDEAATLADHVLTHYTDESSTLFYFTGDQQTDILLRKKEVHDGAVPSGNSVMSQNLHRLSILLDKMDWRERSEAMVRSMGEVAIKYPTSFGVWLSQLAAIIYGTREIAILGPEAPSFLKELLKLYLPEAVIMSSVAENAKFPLLAEKHFKGKTLFYLCENYACRAPVNSITALKSLLETNN